MGKFKRCANDTRRRVTHHDMRAHSTAHMAVSHDGLESCKWGRDDNVTAQGEICLSRGADVKCRAEKERGKAR